MTDPPKISIVVNGEQRSVAEGQSLTDFLVSLDFHPQAVAVEYNGEILKRERFGETQLGEADRLEIVRFVQGG
jgi:thiamine biosynthesis protein ThiS